jgi:hypothetical protein
MRIKIPITGTVISEGTIWDGKLLGDPNDPIRMINIDLGNVSWEAVDVDLENEVMEIEVIGEKKDLDHARQLIEGHSKDELYSLSGCQKLKRKLRRLRGIE